MKRLRVSNWFNFLVYVRTLKYYVDANLESAGDCTPRIKLMRKQYEAMIEQVKKSKDEQVSSDSGTLNFNITVNIYQLKIFVQKTFVYQLLWVR